MNNRPFKCRFCNYTTACWKEAETHFLSRHKKTELKKHPIKHEKEKNSL